jgi:glycerophosphoryl diester phosphodiesterase
MAKFQLLMKKFTITILAFLCLSGGRVSYADTLNLYLHQKSFSLPFDRLPKTQHKIKIIAHRGNHLQVPENTLAAYENAITAGADYVEVDLRTSRDGKLVVLHDESVKKMTGKDALVENLNFDEIKNLKIAPVVPEDTKTYGIPTFESVLALCKGKINIYLDFKEADVAKTYHLIRQAGMQNNVVVYLNKKEQYGQWKKIAPAMPLMASLPENSTASEIQDFLRKTPVDVVDNAQDTGLINILHHNKIEVWLDVQSMDENPAKWDCALSLGVDGLQTDHPAELIKYLNTKKLR